MDKHQNKIFLAVALSESTHIFCCVLPTVISVVSLFSGLGVVSIMPGPLLEVHDLLHAWEIPMIVFSAVILLFGWALYRYSKKIDCHDTGCGHGPCEPRKNKTLLILQLASVLFVINVSVYFLFHRHMDTDFNAAGVVSEAHDHHGHAH